MARLLVQATEALTRWMAHELPASADRSAAADEVVRSLWRYLAA